MDRDRAESGRASGREIEIRDEERGERGQPPLLPRVVTPNAGDISTNQITPRAPPFIIILLVFPLLHPHWMTFPGPYRGTKKTPAPEEDSMLPPGVWCPPVPSWYLPWSSRDLLRRGILSRRSRHLLLACPLHVQRWNLYATLRYSDGVVV